MPLPRPALLALVLGAAGAAAAQPRDAAEQRAYVEGRFVRALTFHAVGDDGAAAAALDEVLALRPDDPAVYDARAEVALARGEAADALFYAERAAALAPASADVRLGLARALDRAGRPVEAVEAAEAARSLAPDDPAVWEELAGLYARAGRGDAEREALAAGVRLHDTAAARLRLSALYERAGDAEAALDAARAAQRLAPDDPTARRRVAALAAPPRPDATADAAPPAAEGGAVGGEAAVGQTAEGGAESVDALLATVEADPRRLDVWARALQALAASGDPRAGAVADDALLLFPAVPAVATPAAEAYFAAGRPADARRAAERARAALDAQGDAPDADDLRARLDRVLAATDG
ncbi:tetratricopeptide repeat protein [Rubrivirga litoralis]|uniref:Tetratricopeptide repeat protein n=1 Tax=Rubrivirga litoralis TaxID=3075598 RepID=A0ABU3BNV8_9BACT|nr:tetratricopeptide repeat protein [Rubrivirga sp. F394]MDT0630972.1 tetratricopeptide repeat protein [Rubrivirga sp. F394]